MTYDDEDRATFTEFGLQFRCDYATQRKISLAIVNTPEHTRWSSLRNRVNYGRFDTGSSIGMDICNALVDAERDCCNVTGKILDLMLG
jgi:hypothetical protein